MVGHVLPVLYRGLRGAGLEDVAVEFRPSIVPTDVGRAKRRGPLFAVASGLFLASDATLTLVLLGARRFSAAAHGAPRRC